MTYHSFREDGLPDHPVLLALHGTGGDEHQFVGLARSMVPGAGIVSPRGDVSEGGANRFFRRTGEGVYDMDDLFARTTKLLQFAEQIRADYPGRPLFAFGYSNGANILAAMLFRQPRLFDRAALLHPLIPWTPEPQPDLRGLPVLISAGRTDPICPLSASLALIDWFTGQAAAVETVISPGGHQIGQSEITSLHRFLSAGQPSA
ncbi:alpha/beta hydrolase [Pseudogemmobacter bohemicus]|uniref:alpha/beta hydrolase n=1 Tax=Pseudogemmobacter bohemicus TaxID=2250708 RepID=UPI000DD385D2|nr:alpha/beta hydrolase [Pseudogemmobacter bohemicus]